MRRTVDENGKPFPEPRYGIYSAYYPESERDKEFPQPDGMSLEPAAVVGYDEEDLRAVVLEQMAGAFEKPVLDYEQTGKETNK